MATFEVNTEKIEIAIKRVKKLGFELDLTNAKAQALLDTLEKISKLAIPEIVEK